MILALQLLGAQVAFVLMLALARGPGRRILKRISDPTLPGFPSVNDDGWSINGMGNPVYIADGVVIYMIRASAYSGAYASGVEMFEGLLVNRMAKAVAMAVSRRQHAQLAYEAAKKELESCR